jgi:hypothetical protein
MEGRWCPAGQPRRHACLACHAQESSARRAGKDQGSGSEECVIACQRWHCWCGSGIKRLEAAELQAFERLQAALSRGNSLEIREARESWLRISESLRKYDLMIEDSRRDAGELVPVSEVKTFISYFITYAAVVTTGRAESLTNELLGKREIEVYDKLRRLFDEAIVTAVFGYLKGRKDLDQRLATYAEECVRGHYAMYKSTPLFDRAERSVLKLIR